MPSKKSTKPAKSSSKKSSVSAKRTVGGLVVSNGTPQATTLLVVFSLLCMAFAVFYYVSYS